MKDLFNRLFNWIKSNKLLAFLLVVIFYLLLPKRRIIPQLMRTKSISPSSNIASLDVSSSNMMGEAIGGFGGMGRTGIPAREAAPRPDVTDRKVITRSSMSLQVKDVRDVIEKIKQKTRDLGGYVVETNITTPELGESGTLVVRVPSDNLDGTLEYFRGLSVKVVSENISGNDITDEYIDIQERVARLENTKDRLEEILDEAETVDEILRAQTKIFSVQDQIDSYKGKLMYMDGASSTTLIRIYLSTDELGLPYTPSQAWRPQVVFKQASRSLLLNLIKIGNAAIWIGVYLPLIAVGILILIPIKKVFFKKKPPSQ